MNKKDKIFIIFISISVIMITAIIFDNISSLAKNKEKKVPQIEIKTITKTDTQNQDDIKKIQKIKADLEKAGLKPQEAKYWKKTE